MSRAATGLRDESYEENSACDRRAFGIGNVLLPDLRDHGMGGLTDAQKRELQKCTYTYDQCMKACPDQLSQSHNQIGECQQVCLNQYYDCRQKARIPGYVRGPGGLTEPTAPPNKSHPTPTPRKGPGTVSGLSNSHPPPTPTPSKKGQ
jgi:hypothetical protein